jgi:segregation and condensation protein B
MLPLKTIVEGLLFASEIPLDADRILPAVELEASREEVESALEELREEYETLGRAFLLRRVAGGYQFRTRPELALFAVRLRKQIPSRLSRAAMETLAVVAYRQPVLRAEIEKIRGVDAGGVLKSLLEKGLIKVSSRDDNLPGRPILYATTQRFLETFDLQDLRSLPTVEEMDQLSPPAREGPGKLF